MKLSEMDWGGLGTVYKDGAFEYFGLLSYTNAPGPIMSFYGNRGFASHLSNPMLRCVICTEELAAELPEQVEGIVIARNPLFCFWKTHERYGRGERFTAPTTVGKGTIISDQAYVSPVGVTIGDNVTIEEFVSVKPGTRIGNHVKIHAGTVLGAGCLITAQDGDELFNISLCGGLVIEDNVTIFSNSSIMRGSFSWLDTRIGAGTVIGSNCVISHNSVLGRNCEVCDCTQIAGDDVIGDGVWFSPGVCVTNSIQIGDRARLMLGAIARKNIEKDCVLVGEKTYRADLYTAIRKMSK